MQTAEVTYRKTATGRTVLYGPADLLMPGRTVHVLRTDDATTPMRAELVGDVLGTRDGMALALIGHVPAPRIVWGDDPQDNESYWAQHGAYRR